MPPLYNWLCVIHAASDVLAHAARIRAAQAAALSRNANVAASRGRHIADDEDDPLLASDAFLELKDARMWTSSSALAAAALRPELVARPDIPKPAPPASASPPSAPSPEPIIAQVSPPSAPKPAPALPPPPPPAPDTSNATSLPLDPSSSLPSDSPDPDARRPLTASRIPSSPIARLFHYGGLATSLAYGATAELLRPTPSTSNAKGSVMLSEANVTRLVEKLSRMRGAALKVGQFLSIQDSHLLPPQVEEIFRRVQDGAHYMPDAQLDDVLTRSLGPSYASHFSSFTRIPFAAASIGQVHHAVLAPADSPTGAAAPVAVKVQYPNVAASIASDLGYVKLLLNAGGLMPKGLYLDKTIEVMKGELKDETSYTREAHYINLFGGFLSGDSRYRVPWAWAGSTDDVLVMERMGGVSVGGGVVERLGQEDRDYIASRILELCLRELFEFRAMQTDPNWTNFLWNKETRQVELVDFGATRSYSRVFIDEWFRLLSAAVDEDFEACVECSRRIGYLTGEESETMVAAHVRSLTLLATPFKRGTAQPVAFGPSSEWARITGEIRSLIPVMLKERLTPPPRETYSLNRKLSGAFLLAARMGARVDCRELWERVTSGYVFGGQDIDA